MNIKDFPKNFLIGTATSSYQVEGATDIDGRGKSIWDTFSRTSGKVANGHTGEISVDQYHRYKEDINLMSEAGFGAYRFSIAWPRIQPDGFGVINQKGFDYYKRLIDELHSHNIQAMATLYHWDLPQPLEQKGGWTNRDTALRFAEYSDTCYKELKESVDMWITLNEPWCSAVLGYGTGHHAPGKKDLSLAWSAGYNLLYGHGLSVQAYRANSLKAPIGISLNLDTPRPASQSNEDVVAADRAMDLRTYFFLNPILGKAFPQRHFDSYPHLTPPEIFPGDPEVMAEKIDFLGLNYYFEPSITADQGTNEKSSEDFYEKPSFHETSEMGWPITPDGLYRQLKWVSSYTEGKIPLYITENGGAFSDELSEDDMVCHDSQRVEYLRSHLRASLEAIKEGLDLRGYFAWSLIDNFEWAFGYTKRFGLIYADQLKQKRIPKDSYYFLKNFIAGDENL